MTNDQYWDAFERRVAGGDARHFVGDRHPRDPQGQWDEHGPGGTKSPAPLQAKPTKGGKKGSSGPGTDGGGSTATATQDKPRPVAGDKAENGGVWTEPGDKSAGAFQVGDYVTSSQGHTGKVLTQFEDTLVVTDGEGGNTSMQMSDVALHAPKPHPRPRIGDAAENGGTWLSAPSKVQDYSLGSLVHLSDGRRGMLVGISTDSTGYSDVTISTKAGTYRTPLANVVMIARKPKPTTKQLIERRRGPQPDGVTVPDDVGGNGVAPYMLDDLPPLKEGRAQIDAVFERHKQFIPDMKSVAFYGVYDRAEVAKRSSGKEAAHGLAFDLGIGQSSFVMMNEDTIDNTLQLELEQSSGWSPPSGARTLAEYVMAHELGHTVDFQMTSIERWDTFAALADNLGLPTPASDSNQDLDDWVQEHKSTLADKVCVYGTTNRLEILAEIWAEYSLSSKNNPPWPWVQAAGDVMRKAVAE